MAGQQFRQGWAKVERELGVHHFTTHQLRHTFATLLRRRGIPLSDIAEMLGHHDMNTVQGYAEFGEEQRQSAIHVVEAVIQEAGVKPVRLPVRRRRRRTLRVLR
jgi:integrase